VPVASSTKRLTSLFDSPRRITRSNSLSRVDGSICVANAGRLDGFWELYLKPWDMAAGILLITEAGGLVGDLEGEPNYMDSGRIVAGNPKIFAQLLQTIQPHISAGLRN